MAHMRDHKAWLRDLRRFGNSPKGFVNYRVAELFANIIERDVKDYKKDFSEACDWNWEAMIKAVEQESTPHAQADRNKIRQILRLHWKFNEQFMDWLSTKAD